MTLLWRSGVQAVHQMGDMHRCVWAPAPQMGAYLAQRSASLSRRLSLTRLQHPGWVHWLRGSRRKHATTSRGGSLPGGSQGRYPDHLPKGSIGHKEPVAAACRKRSLFTPNSAKKIETQRAHSNHPFHSFLGSIFSARPILEKKKCIFSACSVFKLHTVKRSVPIGCVQHI